MERDVTVSVRGLLVDGGGCCWPWSRRTCWAPGRRRYAGARGRRPDRRGPAAADRRAYGRDAGRGTLDRRARRGRLHGRGRPHPAGPVDRAGRRQRHHDAGAGRLADFGVAKDRVQTTGLSMYPVYDYPRYGPPVLRGYRVTQRARVMVPKLSRAGAAITAAVRHGGNAVRVERHPAAGRRPRGRAREGPGRRRGRGHRQGRAVRRGDRPGAGRRAQPARGARRAPRGRRTG